MNCVFLFDDPSIAHKAFKELFSLTELHDEVELLIIIVGLIKLDDVGMVYGHESLNLTSQVLQHRTCQFVFIHSLNGKQERRGLN